LPLGDDDVVGPVRDLALAPVGILEETGSGITNSFSGAEASARACCSEKSRASEATVAAM
jgi:hypothetical protein